MVINEVFEMTREQRNALTDDEIIQLGYAINNYSPMDNAQWANWWGRDLAINQELKARLNVIETSRRAAKRTAQPVEMVRCPGCGQMVSKRLMMNASRGTVCPDCYDRYSD